MFVYLVTLNFILYSPTIVTNQPRKLYAYQPTTTTLILICNPWTRLSFKYTHRTVNEWRSNYLTTTSLR